MDGARSRENWKFDPIVCTRDDVALVPCRGIHEVAANLAEGIIVRLLCYCGIPSPSPWRRQQRRWDDMISRGLDDKNVDVDDVLFRHGVILDRFFHGARDRRKGLA